MVYFPMGQASNGKDEWVTEIVIQRCPRCQGSSRRWSRCPDEERSGKASRKLWCMELGFQGWRAVCQQRNEQRTGGRAEERAQGVQMTSWLSLVQFGWRVNLTSGEKWEQAVTGGQDLRLLWVPGKESCLAVDGMVRGERGRRHFLHWVTECWAWRREEMKGYHVVRGSSHQKDQHEGKRSQWSLLQDIKLREKLLGIQISAFLSKEGHLNYQGTIWFGLCTMSKGPVFSHLCPTTSQKSEISPMLERTECPSASCGEYKSVYRDYEYGNEHKRIPPLKGAKGAQHHDWNLKNTGVCALTD